MRGKVTFLAGFATGYVLGTRAGRQRYEQIIRATRAFANNPTVQSTASQLQHQASGALSTAKDKATGAIGDRLGEHRPSWVPGSSSSSGSSASPTGATGSGSDTAVGAESGWAGSNGHVRP
jgi:hypothetical protein